MGSPGPCCLSSLQGDNLELTPLFPRTTFGVFLCGTFSNPLSHKGLFSVCGPVTAPKNTCTGMAYFNLNSEEIHLFRDFVSRKLPFSILKTN
jgi:hypothetical protein